MKRIKRIGKILMSITILSILVNPVVVMAQDFTLPSSIDKNQKIELPNSTDKFYYQWVKYENVHISSYEKVISDLTTKINDENAIKGNYVGSVNEKNTELQTVNTNITSTNSSIATEQSNLQTYKTKQTTATSELSAINTNLTKANNNVNSVTTQINGYKRDLENAQQAKEDIAKILVDLDNQSRVIENQIVSIPGNVCTMQSLEVTINYNNSDYNIGYVISCEMNSGDQSLADQARSIGEHIKSMGNTYKDVASAVTALNSTIAALEQQKTTYVQQQTNYQTQYNTKNAELSGYTTEISNINTRISNLQSQLSQLNNKKTTLTTEITNLNKEIEKSESYIASYQTQLDKYNNLLEEDLKKNQPVDTAWIESDGTILEMPSEGKYTLWVILENAGASQIVGNTYEITTVQTGSNSAASQVDIKEEALDIKIEDPKNQPEVPKSEDNKPLDGPISNPDTGFNIKGISLGILLIAGLLIKKYYKKARRFARI